MSKILQCYVRHLIFRNVQTIASIMESQLLLVDKKLPAWVEKPVQDMLDDLLMDIAHAMCPVMAMAREAYKERADRVRLLDYIEKKVSESQAKVDLKCHCAGCADYENLMKDKEIKPKTKPFKKLMKKRLSKDEIDEIEFEVRREAKKLKKPNKS